MPLVNNRIHLCKKGIPHYARMPFFGLFEKSRLNTDLATLAYFGDAYRIYKWIKKCRWSSFRPMKHTGSNHKAKGGCKNEG